MLPDKSKSIQWALLLVLGCRAGLDSGHTEALPTLRAQRVTATVQRESRQLVRLSTEHGAILTTPEHSFATPRSGWLSAGRLRPGDWVVSERFGAVRLLSVRSQPVARPVPVFNLSVASSHAYFVGTDRVLVHNTRCRPKDSEAHEADIQQALRERAELVHELGILAKTSGPSARIAELRAQRKQLTRKIERLRSAQRNAQGIVAASADERSRQGYELDHKAAQEALEQAQKELAEFESRSPSSDADRATFAARHEALKKRVAALVLSSERSARILALFEELEKLEQQPTADGDRRACEDRKKKLRAELNLERKRHSSLKDMRNRRRTPEGLSRDYEVRHRTLLQLEVLENELERQNQEAPSEGRDGRIHHLTEQIATIKRFIRVNKDFRNAGYRLRRLRSAREDLLAKSEDTREIDQRIEEEEQSALLLRNERAQLQVRERLLAYLEKTPWPDAPGPVDEARLREFERQLATGLANEQQLSDIERALDTGALGDIRRAFDDGADWQDEVLDEARDINEVLSERDDLVRGPPSPERAAGLPSSFERLQRELREERAAVDAAVSALVNEHASVQTTQTGSSTMPSWQDRLRAIQQEQTSLLASWQARLQARLDSARRQLYLLRSLSFRDDAIEADVVQEIALLEHELQSSGR